jgi:WD40 repeat protein/ribosomal protein S27E
MSSRHDLPAFGSISLEGHIDRSCDQYEAAWRGGQQPRIEEYLDRVPETARGELLRQLIRVDFELRRGTGESPTVAEYIGRFPQYRPLIEAAWAQVSAKEPGDSRDLAVDETHSRMHTLHIRCPHCHHAIEIIDDRAPAEVTCPSCNNKFTLATGETLDSSQRSAGAQRRPTMIGHFELLEQLGTGGFGTVWKARDTKLDRVVAVKIPRRGNLSPEETEKFLREARTAAQLRHPNIVSVHEVGVENDVLYIVSDYIEGRPLDRWLADQKPTVREAAALSGKLAETLHCAHEQGVIHRDLKPANVMMDAAGEPHVMDFGLAKREAGEITMTVEGDILGTPAYMSPEQARGEGHQADRRADVYSLGVILFELLTGERPFRGNVRMLLKQVLEDEPPSPRKLDGRIPRDLETICLKCLHKEPRRRYGTARQLADELGRFLAGQPIVARPIGRLARGWRWCRRNPVVACLTTAVATVLLVGAVVSTHYGIQAKAEAKRADGKAAESKKNAREAQDSAEAARKAEKLEAAARTEAVKQMEAAQKAEKLEAAARADAVKHMQAAQQQTKIAEQRLRVATALRLANESQSVRAAFPQRSLLLAQEAVAVTHRHQEAVVPQAYQALQDAVSDVAGFGLGTVQAVQVGADSRWLFTVDTDRRLHRRLLSGTEARTVPEKSDYDAALRWQAFSPDARWALVSDANQQARLLPLVGESPDSSGVTLAGWEGKQQQQAFAADGSWLGTMTEDGTVRLWALGRITAGSTQLAGHQLRMAPETARGPLNSREPKLLFSGRGKWLLASRDKKSALWDLSAGAPNVASALLDAARFPDRERISTGRFCLSPDERWLAYEEPFRLWLVDLEERQPAGKAPSWKVKNGVLDRLVFSHNSHYLFAADGGYARLGSPRNAWVWNLHNANPLDKPAFTITTGQLEGVAFSADNRWLAITGFSPSEIYPSASQRVGPESMPGTQLVDLHRDLDSDLAPNPSRRFPALGGEVQFSPDGRWLLAGGLLFRIADQVSQTKGAPMAASEACFSPDGRWLVTSIPGEPALVWDLTSPDPAAEEPMRLRGHESGTGTLKFSPDSRWLVMGGGGHMARLCDLMHPTNVEVALRLPPRGDEMVRALAFGANRALAVTAPTPLSPLQKGVGMRMTGTVRLRSLRRSQKDLSPLELGPFADGFRRVAMSADGSRLAATLGARAHQVCLWDLRNGDLRANVVCPENETSSYTFALSPSGRWLAWQGRQGVVLSDFQVWLEMAEEEQVEKPTQKNGRVSSTKAKRLSARTGAHLELTGAEGTLYAIAFDPEERWLAAATGDSNNPKTVPTVLVWDLAATDPSTSVMRFQGHTGQIDAVAISPGGSWLASGSQDKTVRLWKSLADASRPEPLVLRGHEDSVTALAFSPDNRWLASASRDGVVRLWDLTARDPAAFSIVFPGFESHTLLAFPTANCLVIAGLDEVRVHRLDVDELMTRAQQAAGRTFSEAERRRYLPDES